MPNAAQPLGRQTLSNQPTLANVHHDPLGNSPLAVSKHHLDSKSSNSKIVYQTKKGGKAHGRSQRQVGAPADIENAGPPSTRPGKQSMFMSDEDRREEDHQKKDNESSAAGHTAQQLEKHSEEGGFGDRSYGAGNVATYRNEDGQQSANQEKLVQARAPYVTENTGKRVHGGGQAYPAASVAKHAQDRDSLTQ